MELGREGKAVREWINDTHPHHHPPFRANFIIMVIINIVHATHQYYIPNKDDYQEPVMVMIITSKRDRIKSSNRMGVKMIDD